MSIARLAGQYVALNAAAGAAPMGVAGGGGGGQNQNFEALTKYIPTETITIFVAAMSALLAVVKLQPGFDLATWTLVAYFACAALTPILVWAMAFITYRQTPIQTPRPLLGRNSAWLQRRSPSWFGRSRCRG